MQIIKRKLSRLCKIRGTELKAWILAIKNPNEYPRFMKIRIYLSNINKSLNFSLSDDASVPWSANKSYNKEKQMAIINTNDDSKTSSIFNFSSDRFNLQIENIGNNTDILKNRHK